MFKANIKNSVFYDIGNEIYITGIRILIMDKSFDEITHRCLIKYIKYNQTACKRVYIHIINISF